MRKLDQAKHKEKRQEILEAAARCFARDGIRGTSISAICAEAKMSSGHLYHYFKKKEAIVAAMAEARMEAARVKFSQLMESADVVTALLLEVNLMRASRPWQLLLFDLLVESGRNPAIAEILQAHSKSLRGLLTMLIRKGQSLGQIDARLDQDQAATALFCVVDGAKALTLRDPAFDPKKEADLLGLLITRILRPQVGESANMGDR